MGQLNLYKVDYQRRTEFETALLEKYDLVGNKKTINRTIGDQENSFELSFFIDIDDREKPIEWDWLLRIFDDSSATSRSNPKGILVIKENGDIYACSYGFSFFFVDKYCDVDFAFNFARKMEFKEIKTTTLLTPSAKRNKTVNTYIDYNNLEFDSGESFIKLKVKANLPEDFVLFKADIEIGHSIKFKILDDTIDRVIDVLLYVKYKVLNSCDKYKIPIFNRVTDSEMVEQLNDRLEDGLTRDDKLINLSELDIIGATEIFNNNDSSFLIKYRQKSEKLMQLISEDIIGFIHDCGLTLYEGLEKVKIVSCYNEIPVKTDKLYNMIDYTDDEMRCILSKGKWYFYNDDYLEYLEDSLAEIDVIYKPEYDYNTDLHERFILDKYEAEKDEYGYSGFNSDEVMKKIRNKYYRERAYNLFISGEFGFECYDREGISVGGTKIELTDLYKDETLFAVKFGNASSTLCYVVDQSISALKLYKHRLLENLPETKRFGIWLLLDRRTRLDLVNNKPNINQLSMLTLKNRLDVWKKEVRILGYTPIIMINYYNLGDV